MNKIPYKFLDILFKDVELILDPKLAREHDWLGFYVGNRCILGFVNGEVDEWYSEGPFFEPIKDMFDDGNGEIKRNFNQKIREYLSKKFDYDVPIFS